MSNSNIVREAKKITNSITPMIEHESTGILSRLELGNDTLQDQIDQSGDKLANKILFYLSELPIQFSMFQVTQKLDEMVRKSVNADRRVATNKAKGRDNGREWPPTLHRAISAVYYWTMRKRQGKCRSVNPR